MKMLDKIELWEITTALYTRENSCETRCVKSIHIKTEGKDGNDSSLTTSVGEKSKGVRETASSRRGRGG